MQKFVGVFNPEWQLVATLQVDGDRVIVTEVLPHEYGLVVSSVVERLKTENPKLNIPVKDEDGCVLDMVRVTPDDERYMDGVANELKRAGLQAYSLDFTLLPALKKANEAISSLRAQVVPEVVGLDTESALIALKIFF